MKTWLLALCFGLIMLPGGSLAGDYIIGEGDGLDILVWGIKELNVSVKVRPDGKITIPGIGDVKASGVTPQELQKSLVDKLKSLVKAPNVTVTVREITNSKVYIFGGGVKSSVYDLYRRTTLLQLLCTIGEVKEADLKNAYLLRNGKKIKQNFHRLFIGGDTSEDVAIETNDSIYIPLVTQSEKTIYVLGAVNNPKYVDYREGMTVMEAVLEAGGFTKFASQNDTEILRKEGGKEVLLTVKAKDILSNGDLAQNVKLKPNDYVIAKEGLF